MTDYSDPYEGAVSPFDDAYADDVLYPMATAQPGPRPPLRVRLADGMDEALRSPRWDQVRGLVVLGCVTLVGAVLAVLFVLTVVTGVVVLLRQFWEAL